MNTTTHRSVEATALVQFFEHISPQTLPDIATIYAADATFEDPFNKVQGLAAMEAIFAHMFTTLHDPRFVVTRCVQQGHEGFLTWEFHFRIKSWQPHKPRVIVGASHVVWGVDGKVHMHRDYWDAANELYTQLPLLGGLMRWLRRQFACPAH